MSNEYALDVAFSSATIAADDETPMVAAYGFSSLLIGGTWSEDGQKAEQVAGGADFFFAAFDTAATPGTVFEIQIDFGKVGNLTPFVNAKGEQIPSPIVASNDDGTLSFIGPSENSPGCNVKGAKWLAGPYKLTSKKGTHECTVVVSVSEGGEIEKMFSVDPEIVVEGGGDG